MTPHPACALKNVVHRLDEAFTLRIDEFIVATNETVCLVGPTGAGKSTLLKLLSGLAPMSGHCEISGQVAGRHELPLEITRQVVTVHQRPMLMSGSVAANVEYGLRLRGRPNSSQQTVRMLQSLGLEHLARQEARTLSGGQMQLVAIARALVIEPRVLLLDEPTAHLDPAHVAQVETAVQQQQQRTGMTIVWATHNLFQARRVATRIALLLGGNLIECVPSNHFFDHPCDSRTADFVQGKMVY